VGRPEIGRPATGPRAHAGGVAAGVCPPLAGGGHTP
jgi:hypothetical protein